mmetsp:Transcript_5240/g.15017  ORF Transcript_5240/g.15017 Transcript_5240/m.15017 type:complete len:270 (-) Transcript_5240:798-1607(-)|eukprot:CAMPEP_0206138666 /NCGR_PEP_ID=MMETSP1473-20131121/3480_1 /ASSEMBLY_ACC=CAM_ASM_001109 /TAXON_ID=1461547 /ORGANISM="Stichococcus sp, Strain RCC1054" /LENGTH=269 /DNA_ID=CAMNT_0053532161 /DNA_START=205 /DNA_END=1014 /DNA_ORIENTATION=-
MLYLIGLGLCDEKDITVRGLEAVKGSQRVYLEAYTSQLLVSKERLEKYYGKEVIIADREMVESQSDDILAGAAEADVSFLVVGDPFGATTHTDLELRARKLGISVRTIHNASIMNAVGVCGLQLYRFGEAISLVFFTDTWKPDSFYSRVASNRKQGLHTLVLLDIKVKEPSLESLARGKPEYEPARFMSINTAVEQLLEIEELVGGGAYGPDTMCVGLARVGAENQTIVAGPMKQLVDMDFGAPLHTLVIAGELHPIEAEMLDLLQGAP